jgi:hypothetical protein
MQRALGLGVLAALLLGIGKADAGGLPVCRVRVSTSATAAVSPRIVREVESWIDLPDRACTPVESIAEADVLLELQDYTFRITPDERPVQEWRYIARRLGEPNPAKAIYRFGFLGVGPPAKASHAASRHLRVAMIDVCLGLLPPPPPSGGDPE